MDFILTLGSFKNSPSWLLFHPQWLGSWCQTQGTQREMWHYFRSLDSHSLSGVGKEQEARPVKQNTIKCGNQQNRGSEVCGPAGEGEVKVLRDACWWLSLCFVLLSWIPSPIIMFSKEVCQDLPSWVTASYCPRWWIQKIQKTIHGQKKKNQRGLPMKACVRLLRERGLVSPLKSWNGPNPDSRDPS